MPAVFISHTNADKPSLTPLVAALVEARVIVWIDRPVEIPGLSEEQRARLRGIEFGARWQEEIPRFVRRIPTVLVYWSEKALLNKNPTFLYEIDIAKSQRKYVPLFESSKVLDSVASRDGASHQGAIVDGFSEPVLHAIIRRVRAPWSKPELVRDCPDFTATRVEQKAPRHKADSILDALETTHQDVHHGYVLRRAIVDRANVNTIIERFAPDYFADPCHPFLIDLHGPEGAGKRTLLRQLEVLLTTAGIPPMRLRRDAATSKSLSGQIELVLEEYSLQSVFIMEAGTLARLGITDICRIWDNVRETQSSFGFVIVRNSTDPDLCAIFRKRCRESYVDLPLDLLTNKERDDLIAHIDHLERTGAAVQVRSELPVTERWRTGRTAEIYRLFPFALLKLRWGRNADDVIIREYESLGVNEKGAYELVVLWSAFAEYIPYTIAASVDLPGATASTAFDSRMASVLNPSDDGRAWRLRHSYFGRVLSAHTHPDFGRRKRLLIRSLECVDLDDEIQRFLMNCFSRRTSGDRLWHFCGQSLYGVRQLVTAIENEDRLRFLHPRLYCSAARAVRDADVERAIEYYWRASELDPEFQFPLRELYHMYSTPERFSDDQRRAIIGRLSSHVVPEPGTALVEADYWSRRDRTVAIRRVNASLKQFPMHTELLSALENLEKEAHATNGQRVRVTPLLLTFFNSHYYLGRLGNGRAIETYIIRRFEKVAASVSSKERAMALREMIDGYVMAARARADYKNALRSSNVTPDFVSRVEGAFRAALAKTHGDFAVYGFLATALKDLCHDIAGARDQYELCRDAFDEADLGISSGDGENPVVLKNICDLALFDIQRDKILGYSLDDIRAMGIEASRSVAERGFDFPYWNELFEEIERVCG